MPYKNKEYAREKARERYYKNRDKTLAKKRIKNKQRKNAIQIGEVFYNLEVILEAPSYKRVDKNGKQSSRRMWMVKCKCGKEFETSGTKLRRGDIVMCRSCACKLRPQSAIIYTGEDRAFKEIILDRATKSNIDVSITAKQFIEKATSNCFYCGAKPFLRPYLSKRGINVHLNGLDRVDNSKGYSEKNCVPCCKLCNNMKRNTLVDKFIDHIKLIYSHLNLGDDHGQTRPRR